jgi:hypothetical protein
MMAYSVSEWVGSTALVEYQARSGRMRVALVHHAGDAGWHVPSREPGCHTYQTRSLDDAVRYTSETFASLSGARRAARRMGR